MQCKYTESNGVFITVRCRSHSLTKGKIKATKHYTAAMIDWLAVHDVTTNRCYYVPAAELGDGMWEMRLRLEAARNNQRQLVRPATDYLEI